MIKWRLYYGDDSTFDNEKGGWDDAPTCGVVCVAERSPSRGRVIHHSGEFYTMNGDGVGMNMEITSLIAVNPFLPLKSIKLGGQVPRPRWQEIMQRAAHDPDFPRASPRRRHTDRAA